MRHEAVAALAALVSFGAAVAAELPSRTAKRDTQATPATRTCEIDGLQGLTLPNGGCVHFGGYISAGVSAGSTRR